MITAIVAAVFSFLILVYYAVAWWRVGRDPKRGTIATQYEPPLGLSPPALHYLYHQGWDEVATHSALLDLAVHGKLKIFKPRGYALQRAATDPGGVAPEEYAFAQKLFSFGDRIQLASSSDPRLNLAGTALYQAIKNANPGYFKSNGLWALPGALASFFLVFLLMVAGAAETGRQVQFFLLFWLLIWTLGMVLLVSSGITLWKRALRARSARGTSYRSALKVTLFAVPFIAAEFGVGYILARDVTWWPVLALIFLSAALAVFLPLIKAPTAKGRALLDQIEGFREFLKSVDMDAINRLNPPVDVPLEFHPQMPYALALDLETDWAEKFSADLHWVQEGTRPRRAQDAAMRQAAAVNVNAFLKDIAGGNWEHAAQQAAAMTQAVQEAQAAQQAAAAATSASPQPPAPGPAPKPPPR